MQTTTTNTNLTIALEDFKPAIIESFTYTVNSQLKAMIEKHGAHLKGVYNCWSYARSFSLTVQPNAKHTAEGWQVDAVKLEKNAKTYADDTVAAWEAKIHMKLGDLENVKVSRMGGYSFLIEGTRAGKAVRIEQTVIVKTSSKGLVFNQFPSRIYVEGKFISEAKYKEAK